MNQCISDRRHGHRSVLQLHQVQEMPGTAEGHEGNGDVRLDPRNPPIVQLVHHPLDLPQRQNEPQVLFRPPNTAALAVRVSDTRHHTMPQRLVRSTIP